MHREGESAIQFVPVEGAGPDAGATLIQSLSKAETPLLRLVDPDTGALDGQTIYLDFDGESGTTYDGPVRVENVDTPSFQAPSPLVGLEASIVETVLYDLNEQFAGLGVTFTDVRPDAGVDYSTVYVGGDDAAFSQFGSFYGLAEKVDVGNRDRNDEAFVFSDKLYETGMTAGDYESALTAVIDHEARHLLGYEHADGQTAGLIGVAAGAPDLPEGATIVVNSAADTDSRDGFITLREAILINNRTLAVSSLSMPEQKLVKGTPSDATRDRINITIDDAGPQTIFVGPGGLPYITDPVFIDGTMQPGFDSSTHIPLIRIDASGAGVNQDGFTSAGLEITAGSSIVQGLVIGGAPGDGILIRLGGQNTIIGNFIGTDFTGTLGDIFGNRNAGITLFDSADNQIGGANPGDLNLISGNHSSGIVISHGGSTGNVVQGNLVGTDITGNARLGNAVHGILISSQVGSNSYPSANLIGGPGVHQGNVISANGIDGVDVVRGSNNVIQNNFIGTNKDGTTALGNLEDGIFIIDAPGTLVGGRDPLAGNVISSNSKDGIEIVGSNAQGTIIEQNAIGTDLARENDLGNLEDGIFIHGSLTIDPRLFQVLPPVVGAPSDPADPTRTLTTIGGDTAAARNYISGNDRDGIRIADGTTGTVVQANYIGLDALGNKGLGNTGVGVAILDSPGSTIGGVVDEAAGIVPRNVISANGDKGVSITGPRAANNHVLGNFIGTDKNGQTAVGADGHTLGNQGSGVYILDAGELEVLGLIVQPGNVIGDATPGGRNVISGNQQFGVLIGGGLSKGNTVLGNYVGTDALGGEAVPNEYGGVAVSGEAFNNTIGGDSVDARNVISGNNFDGVIIAYGASQNRVRGNFIGTKASGVEALGNNGDGLWIFGASDNDIGGEASVPGAPQGNVISANQGDGINIESTGKIVGAPETLLDTLVQVISLSTFQLTIEHPSTNNRVLGNIIGLDQTGNLRLGNIDSGVYITEGAGNVIGDSNILDRNIISANATGVSIDATGTLANTGHNSVEGNFIGTDITGTKDRGNDTYGVSLDDGSASEALIGNVISGNKTGVYILAFIPYFEHPGPSVLGNYIGVDMTGLHGLPNTEDGLVLESSAAVSIGGTSDAERNVISANGGNGVRIYNPQGSSDDWKIGTGGNQILGNYIGVGIDGATPLGNMRHGVLIENATGNFIGGDASGEGNVIAYNGAALDQAGHGVTVASGTNNLISRNSIFNNHGRGIDLGNDPFTLNDPKDEDIGANNLQNYPVVVFEFLDVSKNITWDLYSTPNSVFAIEFFANESPDPSGFGEGGEFLGSLNVSTDDQGFVEFTRSFDATKNYIAATATDFFNNTSEFSMVDTDADALADAWEEASLSNTAGVDVNGDGLVSGAIDINEDGVPDLELPGANPDRKDLYVEVDAMVGRVPDPSVLPSVEQAFAAAPALDVHNPDGSAGIALHAILDEIALPLLPFTLTDTSGQGFWPEFDVLKADHFGTLSEHGMPYALAAKALVYRYAIFADWYDLTKSSGISELAQANGAGFGGNDFIVTLGTWYRPSAIDGAGNPSGFRGGTSEEQAGTFMHELGHTLGLFHAGDQPDDENYKPNYDSIMNYLWQVPAPWMYEDTNHNGIQDFWDLNGNGIMDSFEPFVEFDRNGDGWQASDTTYHLNYSNYAFNDLAEVALDENAGIGGDLGDWVLSGPEVDGIFQIVPEFGPVDWNRNGAIDPLPVAADLNSIVDSTGAGQLLHGSEDWAHLRFDFRELPNFRAGYHGTDFTVGDIALETQETLESRGDQPGFFQFSQTNSFEVDESGGFATVVVTRSGGAVGTVSVDFASSDGSALAGSDYTATAGTLTFANGEYSQSFTVPIVDDLIPEATESFNLALSNPTGGATLGQRSTAEMSILDDDGPGKLQFGSAAFLADETDPIATITVVRLGGTAGPVSVDFTTADGRATANQDYVPTSGTLAFADGESATTFTISLLDDSIVEGMEDVRLVLSNPTGGALLGDLSASRLIIKDVEPGILQFGDPIYVTGENGGEATITVTRANGSDGDVSVDFDTVGSTATAGSDYTATSGTLAFADGETVKSFSVPILDDTLAEPTETATLVLSNPVGGALLGPQSSADLRILDDEPPTLSFSAPSFEADENGSIATIQVVRTGSIAQNVVVDFATADGTAKAGTDYTATSGTLHFLPGAASATFTVPVTDDLLGQGTRSLQLVLSNPSTGAQIGQPDSATLNIIDDETLNAATFVVTNTNDSGAGSFRQAILDANAHAGTDFINFNIPGDGAHTIQPHSPLPPITSPVTIDGYSEPGASPNTLTTGDNAVLLIELDGSAFFGDYGIRITAGNSIVRGLVINRFARTAGVLIDTNGGNLVTGNFVGTDPTGTVDHGSRVGIKIGTSAANNLGHSSNNVIGGTTPEARNVISGNDTTGIAIDSDPRTGDTLQSRGNLILGNYVGTAADGTSPLGNGTGISIATADRGAGGTPPGNTVGGIEPGAGNVIAFNVFEGVSISSGRGNAVRGNSIFSNDPSNQYANFGYGLGIDLATFDDLNRVSQPITVNDSEDLDTGDVTSGGFLFPGPNLVQNFPVLSSGTSANGTTTIEGRLDSAPGTVFQIDFYANDQIDPSGYGEGQVYIGTAAVTTDSLGHAEFSLLLPTEIPNGRFITATATDPGNNTSEFSARITVGDVLGSVFTVNTTDDVDDGIADAQHTSLREAILAADNHPGPDSIVFNIPGTGTQTIFPLVNLPVITDPVTIDGYTQPGASPNTLATGFDGVLLIQIKGDGSTSGNIRTGLNVAGGGTTVRGLVVNSMENAVFVQGPGDNVIQGNIIGADPTGNQMPFQETSSLSTPLAVANSSRNVIGGSDPASRNLLAGLALKLGADSNRVQGNYIGPRADGLGRLTGFGGGDGLTIDTSSANTIGGSAPGEGNVISGNGFDGVYLTGAAEGNRLWGNFIGVGADGATPLGNGLPGSGSSSVQINGPASGNVIGGIQPGAGNIIAWGEAYGVVLGETTNAAGILEVPGGNAIRGNSIFSNGSSARSLQGAGLGIDLMGAIYDFNAGVTPNDNSDLAVGPNALQNYPVLSSAMSSNGILTIQGRLNSKPGELFQIDFYANDQIDLSGFGEGQTYIGTTAATTDASGHVDFSAEFAANTPDGRFITATATDPGNNTSEFSARLAVGDVLGSVFTVNTADDVDDGIADAQHTSLREAILAANNHPGADSIVFNIPGDGVQTISPLTLLPTISDPVTIDGYTQPGAHPNTLAEGDDAALLIEIKGDLLQSQSQVGVNIRAGDTTVRGLLINGFASGGIRMAENGGNTIEGNFFGTDPNGTEALTSSSADVTVFASSNNLIGGTTPQARNIISGSLNSSVEITGGTGPAAIPDKVNFYASSGNQIQGNYIGTDRTGMLGLGTGGISIGGSSNNVIGGTTNGARNIISSGSQGVHLGGNAVQGSPANNVLQGNYIGTDRTGKVGLGGGGVVIEGTGNTVGGAVPGAGNVISGNTGIGILLFDPSLPNGGGSHLVQGNYIGTDKDGTAPLGNRADGIAIYSSGNTIGGVEPGTGNIISANGGNGIVLTRAFITSPAVSGNLIEGNYIGVQRDGESPLPNLGDGIRVSNRTGTGAVNNAIGGLESGAGNTIAFNAANGVNILGGTRISVLSNSIYSNRMLGIDLDGNGPTPNDTGDGDGGNNNLQNFPVLTSITNNGTSIDIAGTLNSRPNGTFSLEFFDNIAFDPSHYGEGARFIGSTEVTTDASGNAGFDVTLPASVPLGHVITSTATDSVGNTSEFSGLQPNGSPGATAKLVVSTIDSPDPVLVGQPLTYTITVENQGPEDATNVIVLDTLPTDLAFDSASASQGVYGLIGSTVFANLGTIANGAGATVEITVLPTTTGTAANTVTVASDQYDPNTSDNSATESTTLLPSADVAVTKSASVTGPVAAGSMVFIDLTVDNHGPSLASAVQLTDTLPDSMTFGYFAGGSGGTYSNGVVTWDIGSLPSGSVNTVSFAATVDQVGTSTDTAEVTSSTADTNMANNIASLDITALPTADLSVTETADSTLATVGQMLTYTVTVSNAGPSDADGVILSDTLPSDAAFQSATTSQGNFSLANGILTFDLGVVPNGSVASAQIVVIPTVAGSVLTNVTAVTSTGTLDPDTLDNQAALETLVPPALLYGSAYLFGGASTLYAIDPSTGAAALIGPIGFDRVGGMDFDPGMGGLYATGERHADGTPVLITINPETGTGTEVGTTDIGALNSNNTVTDISFRDADGALFAYLMRNGDLATIDLATGQASLVGTTLAEGSAGNGLAFSSDGTLYHADDVSLDTLDPGTGLATVLEPLVFSPAAEYFPRINAMDFDPKSGILFGSLRDAFSNESFLATLDIETGVVSIVGPTVAGLDALAFVPVEAANEPPIVSAGPNATVNEGSLFSQAGSFADPDAGDSWTATVDYGDGFGVHPLPLTDKSFQLSHVFADDGLYQVRVEVTDDAGGKGSDTVSVTVLNVAPLLSELSATSIDENAITTLTGTIIDPGTLDTFTLNVNWGDPLSPNNTETYAFGPSATGSQAFALTHRYLDDNPSGTPSDLYTIDLKVTDDDTGSSTNSATVMVSNVAPALADLSAASINENGVTTLTGTIIDPGTLDTFTLDVIWGDPLSPNNVQQYAFGAGTTGFTLTHQYLDDNPTGTPFDVYTIALTVTDDDTGTIGVGIPITVQNVAPSLTDLSATSVEENRITTLTGTIIDPGTLDTFTLDVNWGDPLSPNNTETYAFGPSATGSQAFALTHRYLDDNPSGTPSDLYTIDLVVTDDDTGTGQAAATLTVFNVAPVMRPDTAAQSVQYSDAIEEVVFTALDQSPLDTMNAWPSYSYDGSGFIAGLPDALTLAGGLSFNGVGDQKSPATWTLSGIADLGPGTYTIRVTVADDDGGVSVADTVLDVMPEDARSSYVGPLFVSTPSIEECRVTVELRALIEDITAVTPDADPAAGNITTATVTFINRDTDTVIAANLPVRLIDPSDPKTGVAVYDWQVDLKEEDIKTFTVGIVVGGYYFATEQDIVITVSKPQDNSITGGGYIVNESSFGSFAGMEGAKTDFGFNVKYNKKLTNLQGHFNGIVRRDDGVGGIQVLQIKSNAIESLVVDPEEGNNGSATFVGEASLTDITDPGSPVEIAGNVTLIVNMTDNGEPGESDTIGFTLWDGSELLFSSNWDGSQTLEQVLGGGNLAVHAATAKVAPTASSPSDSTTVSALSDSTTASLRVVPEPSLDVDANGEADAMTDGVVILRYLFGFTGEALVDGSVDPAGNRTDAAAVAETLARCRDAVFDVDADGRADALFDVDANGKVDALTDGVVILRYLSGIRGDPLAAAAVDPSGNRTDPYEVTAFLDRLFGSARATITQASPAAETNTSEASLPNEAARNYFFADLGSSSDEEDEETEGPLSADLPILLYYDPA